MEPQFNTPLNIHTRTETAIKWGLLVATAVTAAIVITTNVQETVQAYSGEQTARAMASEPVKDLVTEQALAKETNRIIVQFKDDATLPPGLAVAAAHANLEKAQGLTKLFEINGIGAQVYQVAEDDTAAEVVKRINHGHKDLIEYAEVDMLVPPTYIPNDPSYGNQWHLPNVGAPAAWDTAQGEGIPVAVLDTGVNPHPDLQLSSIPGWNFYDNNNDTQDVYGHGTAVSGTIAATGNNGIGIVGSSFKSPLVPIRISEPSGWGNWSAMAQGITYAADKGIRVVNLSYGESCDSSTVRNAASYLRSKGGVIVIAAGNTSADNGMSASPETICVSATGSNNLRTSWSSFGQSIDIAAPGASIYTTTANGGYGNGNGTSFSTPLTAGIYALMFSANPDLSPAQADSILFSTADDIGEAGWDMYYGYGKVNAAKAVALAASTTGSLVIDKNPPTIPGNLRIISVDANQVALAWNQSTDDVLVTGYTVYRDGVKRATITGTTYTDTAVSPETTYIYTVSAIDKSDNESAQSAPVTATTPTLPFSILSDVITNKTATDATLAVALSAAGTVTVRYGNSADSLTQTVSSAADAVEHTLTLSNLQAKSTYYYQVIATSNGTTITSSISSFRTSRDSGTSTGGGGGGKGKNR